MEQGQQADVVIVKDGTAYERYGWMILSVSAIVGTRQEVRWYKQGQNQAPSRVRI
jgi:hypothetical protein